MLYKLFLATALLVSIVCISPTAKAQTVTFNTNVGDIVVELFPNEAPISVDNFLGYVGRGDYEGTIFHRSVNNFIIQGGAFLTNGAQIPLQGTILNEFGRSNLQGTLAYARVGGMANSATSQFFFNVTDNAGLDDVDGGFTVFGEVVSGMDIVNAINGLQTVNAGGAFAELPVQDSFTAPNVTIDDLVILNGVTVEGILGDVNLNGVVDFSDIAPFISLLSMGTFQEEGDINDDGVVSFSDISLFIGILAAG